MSSFKITEKEKKGFEEEFFKKLGVFYKRGLKVYSNYGSLRYNIKRFFYWIDLVCRKSEKTKKAKFDLIITVLEIHWEVNLKRMLRDLDVDPATEKGEKILHDIYCNYLTVHTFFLLCTKLRFFPDSLEDIFKEKGF